MTDPAEPRVVLVTGGSSGIGRATAHQLAGLGERLVLAARSEQALEAARQECVARGAASCLVVPTDVGDRAAVERLFATAVDAFGRVDAVVQAAGVVAYGAFADVPPEVFDKVVRTNLLGTANVARCSLVQFTEQGHGSLVVVGSVLGKMATPLMSAYGTSKWAVHGLVRSLQIEARRMPGIEVSLVSPGSVDTPIYDQAASYSGHAGHPPPPVGRPARSARTIVAALDRPRRDVAVGPANGLMVLGFRLLPGVFDTLVGPLLSLVGQGRRRVEPHPGNVLHPDAAKEAVHGRWPHVWG